MGTPSDPSNMKIEPVVTKTITTPRSSGGSYLAEKRANNDADAAITMSKVTARASCRQLVGMVALTDGSSRCQRMKRRLIIRALTSLRRGRTNQSCELCGSRHPGPISARYEIGNRIVL